MRVHEICSSWRVVLVVWAAGIGLPAATGTGQPAGTGPTDRGYTPADYRRRVEAVKPRVPGGFTVLVQPPFVVIGDEAPARVKQRAERTVKWCAESLKRLYFTREPSKIYYVWLFKDKASYRKHTKAIFGHEPSTPFGYFSSSEEALVMNIGTGGGTLCHEIVHAYVASNFERCPSWFNEGLASLYEQCGPRRGRITGFTNWRLAGLQKAVRRRAVPSFKTLTGTTRRRFYDMDKGSNYAQARYLCYYLQEKGLLLKFYRAFRENVKKDPTGYETLGRVLGERDMAAFQKRWETWVLGLRFP